MSKRCRHTATSAVVAGLLLLTACGGGADDTSDDVAAPDEIVETIDPGAPGACTKAFPAAFAKPDIEDVTLLPDTWPSPPAGSTLCQTAETVGGSRENADYATDLEPEQLLTAYESALDPAYGASRQEGPRGGEVLVGAFDGVDFQITPGDGTFTIALAKS